MSKTEKMKKMKSGNGIQHLLDEGYKILGNPINAFDADYNLMAYTDVSVDDRFWIELITTGTFCIEAQMFFMNECFTDDVANAVKLALMKSDKLKYDRILGHVLNGNGIKVANVLMFECNEPFDQDTIAAFEILVDLLTKEISRDEHYITYGEEYQNRWIKKLIDYDIEEKGLYSPHVQILYDNFKSNLYLAVVDITRSEAQHNGPKYFVDLFRQKRNDFKYAVYDKYIVVILSTNHKSFDVNRELNGLADYFEQENMFVGISSSFENFFELRKYYAEAVQALNRLESDDNRHFSIYGECTE